MSNSNYPTTCPACGTPCRVEGETTKYYVNAYESLVESLILAKKQRDEALWKLQELKEELTGRSSD